MRIKHLTDDIIELFSQDNVLTEYRDFDLHYGIVTPYPNGLYDANIFGSIFSTQCNCGQLKNIEGKNCPRCKSMILDQIQAYRRYARIESPVYYCSELKIDNLRKFLRSKFKFEFNYVTNKFDEDISFKVLDTLQFNYLGDKTIEVTDNITDLSQCSYEGLLAIISQYTPEYLNEYLTYINTNILVVPIIMRPPYYTHINGSKELHNEQLTIVYKNIIYAIYEVYNNYFINLESDMSRTLFRANLRKFLTRSISNVSRLLASSKENYARGMQSSRINNSGRCTIIPDPSLKIDEVYVPTHLIYECCREEFQTYLMDKLEISQERAEYLYKYEALSEQIQTLFTEYIEGEKDKPDTAKYVFILRNPTLHELNIMMLRVRLTNDYCMKIPMAICKPFNADFDGDTMAFFAVPKKSNSEFLETMSPRNLIYYKKNHSPLFTPSHEMMNGLIVATKVQIPEGNLEEFDSIEQAKMFKRSHRNFRWQTLCKIDGEETTLGRAILSELFDKNLESYFETDVLNKHLTAKNIIPLYNGLADLEDRPERIQKIQEFALNVVTMSGATAPTLTQLYGDIDSEILEQIKAIEEDKSIEESSKNLKVTELYEKYVKEQESKFDDSIKLMLNESSRAKVSQALNIVLPQLNVSPDQVSHMSETRLIEGMNPSDYTRLAVENRAVQDIKVDAVPNGGYLTRQFAFIAMSYIFEDIFDEDNPGIEIEAREAEGRTMIDGTIVKRTDSREKIKVRSLVTSQLKSLTVSRDMIPVQFKYKNEARIGVSMMTSLTEGLTQAGLALKHGGSLFAVEPNGEIIADKNCTVELTDSFVHIISDKTHILPKPNNFVLSYSPTGKYKKGEVIGATLKMNTPAYRLDSIVKLCGANGTHPRKKFARNKVLMTDCYAVNDGIIHYKSDNRGLIHVSIGDEEYEYSPDALYLFPEGSVVHKYDRICSGTLDLNKLIKHTNDYLDVFYFFKIQFRELNSEMSSELIEFLYTLLVTKFNNRLKLHKVVNVITNSKSFYTAISFGFSKRRFKNIGPEGEEFISDTISRVMLSLIVNDEII